MDELPPSFPEHDELNLLGSAFTDTETRRELIVGWQSDSERADDLFSWFRSKLDTDPWRVTADPQRAGVDFITFRDADNPAFRGELRIAQEGERAIVVLIAVETLSVGRRRLRAETVLRRAIARDPKRLDSPTGLDPKRLVATSRPNQLARNRLYCSTARLSRSGRVGRH